jgi:hypothetical protein
MDAERELEHCAYWGQTSDRLSARHRNGILGLLAVRYRVLDEPRQLEWVWRTITYARPQRLRRTAVQLEPAL